MSKIMWLKVTLYGLLLLALALLMMQFVSLNQEIAAVNTFMGPVTGYSIGRLMVYAFIAGGVVGFTVAFLPSLVDLVRIKHLQSQLKQQRQRVETLEKRQSAMVAHADLPGQEE